MLSCSVAGCYYYDHDERHLPSEAAPGLRLCWSCRDGMAKRFRRMALVWYQLGEKLTPAGSSALEPRVSASRDPGIELNGEIVERRDRVLTCLASWAGYIAERRGLPAPEREPVALAGFLTHPRNTDWLAASEAASDAVGESTEVLYGKTEPVEVRPSLICPRCHASSTGRLRVIPGPDAAGVIACDLDDRHTWKASQWLELRRMVAT